VPNYETLKVYGNLGSSSTHSFLDVGDRSNLCCDDTAPGKIAHVIYRI